MGHVLIVAALLTLTLQATSACAAQSQPRVNASAQTLADFTARVDAYAKLRDKAGDNTTQQRTEQAAKIEAAEEGLAKRVMAMRPMAKRGDIFTPEISAQFRRLLRPEIREQETKAAILEDNPGNVRFKVNGPYPKDEPLSTVPPNVLAQLPQLPADIEYRFIGKHLILHDARANLVIDYIANVLA